QNAFSIGCNDEEEILDCLADKDPLKISHFEPLYCQDFAAKSSEKSLTIQTESPCAIFLKSLEKKEEVEKQKCLIRSLIESGQICVALEKIEDLGDIDDEAMFLKLWAKSQIKDCNYVLKEAEKIKNLSQEDLFSLSLFYAEALWLSGKYDEGRKQLENLLKQCKSEKEKFRALSQLFLLNINSGEIETAQNILREMMGIHQSENLKERLLISHHKAAVEKSRNNEVKAHKFLAEALKYAKEGGYRLHETLLNMEIGNVLRMIGNFEESFAYLRKAILQSKVLRLKNYEKQAQFDIIIAEVENGRLLKAQEEITSIIESRSGKVPFLESAVEKYWLSLILFLRGELIQALQICEELLKYEKNILDKELYLSLIFLKGNILYESNNLKSFQSLLRKLQKENISSFGPDKILEYSALLLLAREKRLVRISDEEIENAENAFENGTLSSKMAYLLAKAISKESDSVNSALKAYELAKKLNTVLFKAKALFMLYKMNRFPEIPDEEAKEIEEFLRANKIKGELCDLLKVFEKNKISYEIKDENLVSFLFRSSYETKEPAKNLSRFLEFSKLDGALLALSDGRIFSAGNVQLKEKLLLSLGEEIDIKLNNCFVFSAKSKDGIWGAVVSNNPIERENKELFSIFVKLQNIETSAKIFNEEKEDFGIIDRIIIGSSPSAIRLKRKILDAAQFNFPILITGEAGSGKEACAKAIHLSSSRAKKQWVAFNCANLTPTLATSQLFGHKKGSFTGADSDKEGLVSAAKDSTLFLDEIGELPLETQANFLRFLQDGSYQPLGSNMTFHSNARIIAATNRNLEEEVRKGKFREDLYYRLKVITIYVPPLRERKEDIVPLFEKFLEEECEKEKICKPIVKKGVYLKLLSYQWFGNVRELQNFAKRAIVASIKSGVIDEKQVVFEKGVLKEGIPIDQKIAMYEKDLLQEILKRNSYNITESAKEAGLSRQTFYQRVKKFGLI
ncbi:MAG: sigma 54-interacting transcriptional regulator, partial [Acidobacteria bacterium]|nr:sigma 54-interacting transcriptional regulator [Acidobacteriota bacterium]